MQYSNPRREVIITDWPYSHSKRTTATFSIEEGKGKERAVRVTVNPKTGRVNAPKKMTYARKVLFVDGDDGKLYILQSVGWGFVVMQSNMKYQEEVISIGDVQALSLARMFDFDEEVTIEINV